MKEGEVCSPTTQGPKDITVAEYTYDETNHMVMGTNKAGEASLYTYNGLNVRVGTELILKDNTHGYTDFHCQTPSVETGISKPEVVKSDYTIDYARLNVDQRVLVKYEEDGYDFRYVYGLDKLQVKVVGEGSDWWGQKVSKCVNTAYIHTDVQGSVVNFSDQYGRVSARADYTEWGGVRRYTDITVNRGFRILTPELTYAGHEYDEVLGQFYAKARFYDPAEKRFTATDPVKGNVTDPLSLVSYLYCVDNPLRWVDPLGLRADIGGAGGATSGKTMYITGEGVAFRQGPGKNYSLVSGIRLSKGETVLYQGKTVDGINDGYTWSQVIYKSKVGWVAARYLSGHPQVNPIPKAKPAVKLPDVKNIQQIDHNKATPNTDVPKIPAPSHSEELMNGLQRLGEDAVSGATGVVAGFVFTMADSGVTATGGVIETFAPFMYSKEAFDNAHQEIQETDQMVADWAPNSSAYYDGKLFGDIIAGIAGLKSAISGAGGALDGMIKLGESAALAVSGAGAPVAVPVAVGGAGEVALGTVAVYVGGTVVLTAADAYDRDSQKAGESKQEKLECEGKSERKRGVGGKGWRGDRNWRQFVEAVKSGGTIKDFGGQIPTEQEALDLISEAGGTYLRTEAPHSFPNPHNFWHINYVTETGVKGTIQILVP